MVWRGERFLSPYQRLDAHRIWCDLQSENLGANARCRGERSRAIGWEAEKTVEDMRESIRLEVEYMLSRRTQQLVRTKI